MLKMIQEYMPSSIIAGGVLRDLYHDKPINDIDIYVPCTVTNNITNNASPFNKEFWEKVFKIDSSSFMGFDRINKAGSESYDGKNGIETVWEIKKGVLCYNIIVVDINPTEYVETYFDIGLCKAYCDGKRIHLSAEFMHDSQNKNLTIVSKKITQNEFTYMMKHHVPKLKRKYQGYSLVVPDRYSQFYFDFTLNNKA